MKLEGKVAVVIGAGSGIGRGIALALARAKMIVVAADIELDSAQVVSDEIIARGGRAMGRHVDATNRDSLEALAAEASAAFGGVHVLSNNAGVAAPGRLDSVQDRDWAWTIEFNLMSIVRPVGVFLPRLRQQAGGAHIVNNAAMSALVAITAPSVGSTGVPIGVYTATKHAVLGYTETLRFELAPEGIGVSMLSTGTVASRLRETSARNRPEAFGGPFEPARRETPAVKVEGPPPPGAEEVGDLVVAAIQANRLHIVSHPEWIDRIAERHKQLMADIMFSAAVSGARIAAYETRPVAKPD